jgi:hypothetical protein
MPNKFEIDANEYLVKTTVGYFNQDYLGMGRPGNPDFLNVFKNKNNSELPENLLAAKEKAKHILVKDLPKIVSAERLSDCVVVCVPRAKAHHLYFESQLMLLAAIQEAAKKTGVQDGTDSVVRTENTRTTHLSRGNSSGWKSTAGWIDGNDGSLPYPGVTRATCTIRADKIKDRNIILVDDIYTRDVNIDEDCIQALYDCGARNVVFYAIARTKRYI